MNPPKPEEMRESPWHRSGWEGKLISVDGVSNADFTLEDVWYVAGASKNTDKKYYNDYDEVVTVIVRLKDGRYVGWESWIDVTGSGFCQDAYGGDVDILFAKTYHSLLYQFSQRAREDFIRFEDPEFDLDLTFIYPGEIHYASLGKTRG